jgi:hypothetical protein
MVEKAKWKSQETLNESEIGVASYEDVENLCESEPRLVDLIQSELEDGKITRREFSEICRKSLKFRRTRIVKKLKK